MDYVSKNLDMGKLEGMKVNQTTTIYICFFVDDLGIFIPTNERNFKKMQEILFLYEEVASAKMNLLKMVIIPLALPTIPQWVINSGYKVSALGEIQRYLGAPIGY